MPTPSFLPTLTPQVWNALSLVHGSTQQGGPNFGSSDLRYPNPPWGMSDPNLRLRPGSDVDWSALSKPDQPPVPAYPTPDSREAEGKKVLAEARNMELPAQRGPNTREMLGVGLLGLLGGTSALQNAVQGYGQGLGQASERANQEYQRRQQNKIQESQLAFRDADEIQQKIDRAKAGQPVATPAARDWAAGFSDLARRYFGAIGVKDEAGFNEENARGLTMRAALSSPNSGAARDLHRSAQAHFRTLASAYLNPNFDADLNSAMIDSNRLDDELSGVQKATVGNSPLSWKQLADADSTVRRAEGAFDRHVAALEKAMASLGQHADDPLSQLVLADLQAQQVYLQNRKAGITPIHDRIAALQKARASDYARGWLRTLFPAVLGR